MNQLDAPPWAILCCVIMTLGLTLAFYVDRDTPEMRLAVRRSAILMAPFTKPFQSVLNLMLDTPEGRKAERLRRAMREEFFKLIRDVINLLRGRKK